MKRFGLVLDGTWRNVRSNALMGNDPEKVSNVKKTNWKATNKTRKEGLTRYADMTIHAIDPAGAVSTMCPHKLPTTIVTFLILSNLWYLIASLWLKCIPCRTLLIFVALLTLRVRARSGGLLVRFSAVLPTNYQLIPSEEIPGALVYLHVHLATAVKKSVSFCRFDQQYWPYLCGCISYLFWAGQHGAKNKLQFCNNWESPCWK